MTSKLKSEYCGVQLALLLNQYTKYSYLKERLHSPVLTQLSGA